jgi:hypothetical protein
VSPNGDNASYIGEMKEKLVMEDRSGKSVIDREEEMGHWTGECEPLTSWS